MRVFGLTGGVASGKSVVAEHWRGAGLAVIDADELAHHAVEPSQPAFGEIVARFGLADDRQRFDVERCFQIRMIGDFGYDAVDTADDLVIRRHGEFRCLPWQMS